MTFCHHRMDPPLRTLINPLIVGVLIASISITCYSHLRPSNWYPWMIVYQLPISVPMLSSSRILLRKWFFYRIWTKSSQLWADRPKTLKKSLPITSNENLTNCRALFDYRTEYKYELENIGTNSRVRFFRYS